MAQAAQEGSKSGDPSSPTVGSKKSSVAQAAGAEIVAPPARIKLKPKDQLQKTVFREQVNNFAQNAFITGVNNLQMNLDVSLNFFFQNISNISLWLLQNDSDSDGASSTESTRGLSPRSKK